MSASNEEEQQHFCSKLLLKSAIKVSEKLLVKNNYIPEESVKEHSTKKAIVMGHEIYNRIVDMVDDMILVEDEELVLPHERNIDDNFIDCATMSIVRRVIIIIIIITVILIFRKVDRFSSKKKKIQINRFGRETENCTDGKRTSKLVIGIITKKRST